MPLSARNQIKGTVTRVTEGEAIANVEIDASGQRPSPPSPSRRRGSSACGRAEVTAIIKASDVILATGRLSRGSALARPGLAHGLLDLLQHVVGERLRPRGQPAVHLIGAARAHDRRGDRLLGERPADGQDGQGGARAVGHALQALDQLEVAPELGLLEARRSAAPVVSGSLSTRSRLKAPVSRPEAMGE